MTDKRSFRFRASTEADVQTNVHKVITCAFQISQIDKIFDIKIKIHAF